MSCLFCSNRTAFAPLHQSDNICDCCVDIIISSGYEAGGHTGEIGSIVLIPQIVDAVAPLPVLAGGGIANGRQMAAALVLGAQGVWCGSVWLTTNESDCVPALVRNEYQKESLLPIQFGLTALS